MWSLKPKLFCIWPLQKSWLIPVLNSCFFASPDQSCRKQGPHIYLSSMSDLAQGFSQRRCSVTVGNRNSAELQSTLERLTHPSGSTLKKRWLKTYSVFTLCYSFVMLFVGSLDNMCCCVWSSFTLLFCSGSGFTGVAKPRKPSPCRRPVCTHR